MKNLKSVLERVLSKDKNKIRYVDHIDRPDLSHRDAAITFKELFNQDIIFIKYLKILLNDY